MHSIVIADDHPLFRDAMRCVLQRVFPDVSIIETPCLTSTIDAIDKHPEVGLILLDLKMEGMDGVNGIIKIRNQHPNVPIVVVSSEDNKTIVLQTITCGAISFISKSTEGKKIGEALVNILNGQVYLPPDIIKNGSEVAAEETTKNESAPPPIDISLVVSLTRRQLLVLEHIVKGQSNKRIAYDLNIAETTVKSHVSTILNKLNVNNRVQAALRSSNLDFNRLLNRV
jgi:DNA-binding NarL/FixJ family response regulator